MRDYGKVYATFWTSPTTRDLSDDAKMLALYLLTSPHTTAIGAFRLPDGYVCEDLHWSSERVSKGFAELLAKGFANRCETTQWVWIRKHLDWNPPENPNQRKSAAKLAAQVPDECEWKQQLRAIHPELFGNPSETVSKPEAVTETETEERGSRKRVDVGRPESVTEQTWTDFLAIRKAKRAPLTDTALKRIQSQADKGGRTLEQALSICCERGWQAYQADWDKGDAPSSAAAQPWAGAV